MDYSYVIGLLDAAISSAGTASNMIEIHMRGSSVELHAGDCVRELQSLRYRLEQTRARAERGTP